MTGVSLSVLLAVSLSLTPPVVGTKTAKDEWNTRVKTTTRGVSGSKTLKGIVGSIDRDGVVLVEISDTLAVKEHVFKPIDLLRDGEMVYDVLARSAYRWGDVKAGDTVVLEVAEDHVDKEWYCLTIHIARRPKGRLPASQLEKEDQTFPARRIINDIENGVDVSDEEIMKVYPPRKEIRDTSGNQLQASSPGGLNKEWQAKLDAIRAKKKEKDLKAPPPEKK